MIIGKNPEVEQQIIQSAQTVAAEPMTLATTVLVIALVGVSFYGLTLVYSGLVKGFSAAGPTIINVGGPLSSVPPAPFGPGTAFPPAPFGPGTAFPPAPFGPGSGCNNLSVDPTMEIINAAGRSDLGYLGSAIGVVFLVVATSYGLYCAYDGLTNYFFPVTTTVTPAVINDPVAAAIATWNTYSAGLPPYYTLAKFRTHSLQPPPPIRPPTLSTTTIPPTFTPPSSVKLTKVVETKPWIQDLINSVMDLPLQMGGFVQRRISLNGINEVKTRLGRLKSTTLADLRDYIMDTIELNEVIFDRMSINQFWQFYCRHAQRICGTKAHPLSDWILELKKIVEGKYALLSEIVSLTTDQLDSTIRILKRCNQTLPEALDRYFISFYDRFLETEVYYTLYFHNFDTVFLLSQLQVFSRQKLLKILYNDENIVFLHIVYEKEIERLIKAIQIFNPF
jgi:hypothetical protein